MLQHSTFTCLQFAIINSIRPLRIHFPDVADVHTVREPEYMLPPWKVIFLPAPEPPPQWKNLVSSAYPVRRRKTFKRGAQCRMSIGYVCVAAAAAAICIVHYQCRKPPPHLTLRCWGFCGSSLWAGTISASRSRSRSQGNADHPNIPSSGTDGPVLVLGKPYVYYQVSGV